MSSKVKLTRYKKTTLSLVILAIICTLGSFAEYFSQFIYYGEGENAVGGFIWKCDFVFPHGYDYTEMIFRILPFLLLIIYAANFYEKIKGRMIMPVLFAVLGLYRYILPTINNLYYDDFTFSCLIDALLCIPYILAIIAFVFGKFKRVIVCALTIIELIVAYFNINALLQLLNWWIHNEFYLFIVTDALMIAGDILMIAALYLFVLANNIPSGVAKKHDFQKGTNIEQELKKLDMLLEMKGISIEEYVAKRKTVLSIGVNTDNM